MDLKETDILGEKISAHWYYRAKAKAMTRLLVDKDVSTILDVGAGSGFFSKHLLHECGAREAWCVDISYESEFDDVQQGKPIHFRKSVEFVNADLVLLMDVLEHVDDDIGLLTHYANKVPQGTRFLITVPAFQCLWSSHDVFLEHKRRYRLDQIESTIARAGLKVTHGSYYFGAVLPLAIATRSIKNLFQNKAAPARSQLKLHHPLINSTLALLSDIELAFFSRNRLAGLSTFSLAEKI